MDIKQFQIVLLCVILCAQGIYSSNAAAEENFTFEKRYNWNNEPEGYVDPHVKNATDDSGDAYKAEFKSKDEPSFEERLLGEIPYGEELRDTWHFVDGKSDIMGMENLRVDRGNKGVSYTTSHIPIMGKLDGVKMKFEAGETHKVSFKSETTPIIGRVKGLSYKGSMSNKDSKIFAQYTYKFD